MLNGFLPGDSRLFVAGDGSMRASIYAPSPTDARAELDVSLVGTSLDIDGREIRGDISLSGRVEHGDLAEGRFELGETTLSLERMILPDPKRERQEERQTAREEKAERRAEQLRERGKLPETVEPEAEETPEETGWWAYFRIAGGTFVAGRPILLDTHIDFELRDTRPLLYLFFAKKKDSEDLKTPAWVGMVPNVQDLEGDASFDIGPEATVIDDVLITSQKLDVMARVRSAEGQKTGPIYVRFGVFDVGSTCVRTERRSGCRSRGSGSSRSRSSTTARRCRPPLFPRRRSESGSVSFRRSPYFPASLPVRRTPDS